MTGLILRTWTTHDGTTMAIIKTDDRREVPASVPFGSEEGQRVRQVDGRWVLQARAA